MKRILIVLCLLYPFLFSTTAKNSNSSTIDLHKTMAYNNPVQVVKKNVKAVRFKYGTNQIEGSTTVTIVRKEGQLFVDCGDPVFYPIVYESDRSNYKYCFKLSGFMYYFNL